MPWQQLVADVGGELIDGIPAYREVVVTVPRQSGKTTLQLAWMIQRALGWGSPQRIIYSAQSGADARKKLIDDWKPVLEPRKKALGITRIYEANGAERVPFRNGSLITLLASTEESGHGKTLDLAVKDELFADKDYRRDQTLLPAMSTRAAAQILTSSTAGDDSSIALAKAVEAGRAAVLDGRRDGVAYFEWSADDGDDLDDPECWWSFMPALGHTIGVAAVEHARSSLAPGEFRRAYGNVATTSDERIIPTRLWDAVCRDDVTPLGRLMLAVDVNPERSAASIAVADESGALEVVDHRPGTGWVVPRVAELAARHSARVALDPAGPVGAMRAELAVRVDVVDVTGREFAQACGAFYDDVVEGRARIRRHDSLDAAVAGAKKRTVGDAWAWARKDTSVDVSPLVAVTIARWAAMHVEGGGPVFAY
jgi:hypothetical protein